MSARVGTRTSSISLGTLLYLVIGVILTASQDYWNFTDWDGHALASLFTAVIATVLWPLAIFYHFILTPR